MKQRVFEEEQSARWAEFEALVELADANRRRRPIGETRSRLAAFPERYRQICRDLAVATERRYSPNLLDRLNRMSLDGHRILNARNTHLAGPIIGFVARGFPRAVRRERARVLLSTALFLLPALGLYLLILTFPELIYSVMSPDQVRSFEGMYDPVADHVGSNRAAADDVAMFGFYIFNNIGIAFRAYAGGIVFGIGAALVLVFNGIQLGAVAAHIEKLGFEETFYSFVIGHGAFELTAIVLAGAAGLQLGWAILAPGPGSRVVALRRAAAESMALVYGVFGMLVLAAVIEAFWSSKGVIAAEQKFFVGAGCWAFVLLYFLFAGRGGPVEDLAHRQASTDGRPAERSLGG